MTQRDLILKHLRTHKKGITSMDAIMKYGCTRLSAVIRALEDKGNVIEHIPETVKTRYGKVSITRYKLNAN